MSNLPPDRALIPLAEDDDSDLTLFSGGIRPDAAAAADNAAAATAFARYKLGLAPNTLRHQRANLTAFAEYLGDIRAIVPDSWLIYAERLFLDPEAWRGISAGIVEGFRRWQEHRGFAQVTITQRLSTVRRYAQVAAQSKVVDLSTLAEIREVRASPARQHERIDRERLRTRVGNKKAEANLLTGKQVRELLAELERHTTPQGRRDTLLVLLMLHHGLRVSEVAGLRVAGLDERRRRLTFFRQKVGLTQTISLSRRVRVALSAYLVETGLGPDDPLLLASTKYGTLRKVRVVQEGSEVLREGMTTHGMGKRLRELGALIGLTNLSPHDLRHTWATFVGRRAPNQFAFRDAGGWKTTDMPNHYVGMGAVANAGVVAISDQMGASDSLYDDTDDDD